MSERGAASGRVLVVGGILAALVGMGIAVGLLTTGGGSDGSASPPVTPPSITETSTPSTPSIQSQVRAAYLKSWAVYSKALVTLDTSTLSQAFTGAALRIVTRQVEKQRAKYQPNRISIEHHIRHLTLINETTASIDDRYVDTSVPLDPKTLKPSGPPSRGRFHQTYTLKLENGTWKVAFIVSYK